MVNACRAIVFGRMAINGQACIAPEFVMVHRKVYDKFLAEMRKVYKLYFNKKGEKEESDEIDSELIGKIINEKHYGRVMSYVENPGEGATLEFGNKECCNKEKLRITPFFYSFTSIEEMAKSNLRK